MDKEPEPQSNKPSEPQLFQVCPTCQFSHARDVPECEGCGLIFSRWKDPAKRAAEAKLARLAQESEKGLPSVVKFAILIVIGIPLLIFWVPDIGKRLMGATPRYRYLEGGDIRYQSQIKLNISDKTPNAEDVSQLTGRTVSSNLDFHYTHLEKDSSSNVKVAKAYTRYSIEGVPGFHGLHTKPQDDLSKWNHQKLLSPLGKHLSLDGSAGTFAYAAHAAKKHSQLRQAQTERMAMQAELGWDRQKSNEPPPPPVDPLEEFIKHLGSTDSQAHDIGHMFMFPLDTLKKGESWTQGVNFTASAGHVDVSVYNQIEFTLVGFERRSSGFCYIVEWNSPMKTGLKSKEPGKNNIARELRGNGVYKGRAWINHKDGFIDELRGTFLVSVGGPSENVAAVLDYYDLVGAPAGAALFLTGNQHLKRI